MTIHVVEDDSIYGEFIKRSLEQNADYKVTVFGSAEAWLAASPPLPDAIISDHFLSGMPGIEFYEAIRGRLTSHNRFILVSSIDDGGMVLGFIKRGIRDYVIKDDSLIDSLKTILEGNEDLYYLFD